MLCVRRERRLAHVLQQVVEDVAQQIVLGHMVDQLVQLVPEPLQVVVQGVDRRPEQLDLPGPPVELIPQQVPPDGPGSGCPSSPRAAAC